MRTTLDLNASLLSRAKSAAARESTTLTRLIEEGLAARLRARPAVRKAPALPVFKGRGGLVKGLDGRSNRALLDAADDSA